MNSQKPAIGICEKSAFHFYLIGSISGTLNMTLMRWAGRVTRVGEMRDAYIILIGRLEWKRLLGRPRHRWEDNI
jgi:hypothetical protein